jgi:hypothetical protein
MFSEKELDVSQIQMMNKKNAKRKSLLSLQGLLKIKNINKSIKLLNTSSFDSSLSAEINKL